LANDVVLVAVGCLTGVLAGMLGAGGGFAAVTLLMAAGAGPHVAVGTSLVYLMVMGGWGTFVHLRLGWVDRRLVVALGVAAALFALVGAQAAEALSNRNLTLALGLFTACVSGVSLAWPETRRPITLPETRRPGQRGEAEGVAGREPPAGPKAGTGAGSGGGGGSLGAATGQAPLRSLLRRAPGRAAGRPPAPALPLDRHVLGGSVAGGGVIGLLKGLFGVGAGFLIVPLMVSVARVPRKLAVGSSLFAILVASVVAAVRHWTLGNVDGSDLLFLVPGGLFGSFAGARAARGMSPAAIRRVFLTMMGASAVYLLALAAAYPR
jgi:uncharacterized membrane protein YfcA